ncbi:insulinase family protein [Pseudoalteromonas viridis]|uniref:Insulinase family protein n=1 Tax=Pseudoalteromonas viridis TaxID=339617 RepID=A0ABX7UZG1_9GAMM|nr:insulinase family protein [Pseudoalteromonas viridis]QTL34019.1 insulinase family protein [Pseudoalteromonas viridis]
MSNSSVYKFIKALILLTIFFVFSAKSDEPQHKSKVLELSNGIPYYHIKAEGEIARYALFVKAGHLYHNGNKGIPHLTEHLFNLGGSESNTSIIDEFLARVGGNRIANVNSSGVRYWYEFPSKHEAEFIDILSNSFKSINLSDEALKAQIAAIENEWRQGQKHLELINWEQAFNVFAKSNAGATFFMGNESTFEPQAESLKASVKKNFSRYNPENIFILSESPNSAETSFKKLNNTLGKLTFNTESGGGKASDEPQLIIESITEIGKSKGESAYQVNFDFAIPTTAKGSIFQAEFLAYLLEKSKIKTLQNPHMAHEFQLSSTTFTPNYYHEFDSLNLKFSGTSVKEVDINTSAKQLLALVQQFLSNLTKKENAAALTRAYIDYRDLKSSSCKESDLSFESAKKLDNSIHFGALDNWINNCKFNDNLNNNEFKYFINQIKKSEIYTKLSIPEAKWEKDLSKIQTMRFYDKQFTLSGPVKPVPYRILDEVDFPKRNRYLDGAPLNLTASEQIDIVSLNNGRYAINKRLKKRFENLDDYVQALVLKAFLEHKYKEHILDSEALATTAQFIIDGEMRFLSIGAQSVVSQLANDIKVPSQLSDNELQLAKAKAISNFKAMLADNQVFRIKSLLNRIKNKQTWSDTEIMNALSSFKQLKSKKAYSQNDKPKSLNIELENNAPVNILTSLRQTDNSSIETKLYAILLNSMIKSDYEDRFRNQLKIAYTAVTDFQLSDHGTGFVTLLQTSTHSIDEMRALNQTFFSDMLKKVKQLNQREFDTLAKEKLKEIHRLSEKVDFVFTDKNLKQLRNNKSQGIDYSFERYNEFAETLLASNKNERYIAFKGL